VEIVALLLSSCVDDVDQVVKTRDRVSVHLLMDERKVLVATQSERTPLFIACEKCQCVEVVVQLLEAGAEIEAKDHVSPLVFLVIERERASFSVCLQIEMTPLHIACRHGHAHVVAALLRAGAKTEARDKVRISRADQ
jgi:ankyrin repeat protein